MLSDRETALYKLFRLPGQPLYIGIAFDPDRRLAQHRRRKAWWTEVNTKLTEIAWYPSRAQAEAAELSAIRSERPIYNIVTSDEAGCARFLPSSCESRWGRPRWSISATPEVLAKVDGLLVLRDGRDQMRASFVAALAKLTDLEGDAVPIAHIADRLKVERKTVYRHLGRSMS